jgi:hypothetical protein
MNIREAQKICKKGNHSTFLPERVDIVPENNHKAFILKKL